MTTELLIFDVLSVVKGERMPGSTENGISCVLEACIGRKLNRCEWVDAAEQARRTLLGRNPNLSGVPVPFRHCEETVIEWKRAVFSYFGLSFIIPHPDSSLSYR